MKNFIPVMRAKRLLEMKQYLDKGYGVQDKKHYLMLEKITLEYMDVLYEYGIQVTQDEVYFYICRDNANIYLSIVEIYKLLVRLAIKDKEYFLNCLKKQLKQKASEKGEFYNQGLSYKVMRPIEMKKEAFIDIPQTGIQITSKELFLLIILIQEKSNALFKRSTGNKRLYVNGILRLLIVLLEREQDDTLLKSLGWSWNAKEYEFQYVSKDNRKGREIFKYYLTKTEYDVRLNTKKS